jgi:hypothetical protein
LQKNWKTQKPTCLKFELKLLEKQFFNFLSKNLNYIQCWNGTHYWGHLVLTHHVSPQL